jgi:hypothetical protein
MLSMRCIRLVAVELNDFRDHSDKRIDFIYHVQRHNGDYIIIHSQLIHMK